MTRTIRVAGLTCVVLGGLAGEAGAVDLKVVGAWTAFRTQTSDGTAICGVSSALSDGRIFYLKWYKGDDYLTVQAFKESWQIPPKVTAKVSLTFQGNSPWTANSAASDKVSNIVEFNFPKGVVRAFVKEFTTSRSGTLQFTGGSEAPWPLDLTGTPAVIEVMAGCIDEAGATDSPLAYLRKPAPSFQPQPGAPQPFAQPNAPQPFAPQPSSPQPFAPQQPAAPRPTQPF